MNRLNSDRQLSSAEPLIIWRLIDGKPGHENQSLGLVNALSHRSNCQCFDIRVSHHFEALANLVTRGWTLSTGFPLPDLIIGAGHATHLHLLAAKRAFGGKTIVLMQPSLPVSWFDLCIIPQHDQYQGSGTYIETKGVLNLINAEGEHQANHAVIMIGGPSKHCTWDTATVIAQVYALVKHNPNINYTLTTSRRTSKDFIVAVKRIHFKNLIIVPYETTAKSWVSQRLAESSQAWVTEDSVSMVYESLTASVAVGLLNLQANQTSRVYQGVNRLVAQNLVTRFDFAGSYQQTLRRKSGFAETTRCSEWILHKWLHPNTNMSPVLVAQAAR